MQFEKPQKNPKTQRTGHIIAPNFVPIDIFNSKPYTCNRCNHRTSTLKKLDEHMRIHTGERPFVCKTCGYATRNASALSYHLKTHKENRPFTCNLCNYRNTTLSSLRSHKTRIHLYQPSTSVLFQWEQRKSSFEKSWKLRFVRGNESGTHTQSKRGEKQKSQLEN